MFHAAQGLDWISRDRRLAADLFARAQVAERQGRHAEAQRLQAQAHQIQARLKARLYRHEDRVDDARRPPAMPPGVHPAARDPRMRGYMPAAERGWIPPWSPPPPRPLRRAPGPYEVVPPHRGYRRLPPGHTVQPRRVLTEAGVLRPRPFTDHERRELAIVDAEIARWKRRRDWAQLHAPRRVIDAQAHLDKWNTRRAQIFRHAGQQHIFERGIEHGPRHAHMRPRPHYAPAPRRLVATGARSPWSVPGRGPIGPRRPIIIDARSVAPAVDYSVMDQQEQAIPGRGVRPERVRNDDGGNDDDQARAAQPGGADAHLEADASVSGGFMGGWGKWLLLGALGVGIAYASQSGGSSSKAGGGSGSGGARTRDETLGRTPLGA